VVLEVAEEHLSAGLAVAARLAERVVCGGAALREALVALGAPSSATVVQRGLAPGLDPRGPHGLPVPARAPVALATRLGSLLDDKVLASRLREGARRSAEEAASPRARALELSRCYAAVARPRPAPVSGASSCQPR
jgi:hypothetical protein